MSEKGAVHQAASWVGLAASVLTLVLGIFHVCNIKARIKWPSNVIADVQAATWRAPLFTFAPDLFLDVWTPFFYGLVGCLAHTSTFRLFQRVAKDYIHYFVFLLIQGLFSNIGYDGGLGIIVSAFSFLGAAFAVAAFFMDKEAHAALGLDPGVKVQRPAKS